MGVVSFSIFKGGTGKTTTVVCTAAALAAEGKRVLLVDLDQQASATRYLDLDPAASPNLYDLYTGAAAAGSAIRRTDCGIDVLAAHVLLAAIEQALEPGEERALRDFLRPMRPAYDFILIDTPPGKAMLTCSGLLAADLIVVPASAERMALDGIADLLGHVRQILWRKFDVPRQEMRILFTMYRIATLHSRAVVAEAQATWPDLVLPMRIPHSTMFPSSYEEKRPAPIFDPRHLGSMAYQVFADWLVEHEATTN